MKLHKLLSIGLAAAMFISGADCQVYADNTSKQDNPSGLSYHSEVEPIADELDRNKDEVIPYQANGSEQIPAKYTTPNLPTIRNQNPYGTCWAFASTALAEISIQKGESKTLDLSELQLVYFTNNTVVDPLGGTQGDTNKLTSSRGILNSGGSQVYAMQAYAGWKGAVLEDKVPYSNAYSVAENGLDDKYAFDDAAHLKNAYIINIRSDADEAKQMIMDNGAISISYCDENKYYNLSNNSYYCPNEISSNHGVTIVGWDDNFSKNNFSNTPEGDGAWLIRNSWGVNDNSHYGYFWLSYYDKSIYASAYAFEFVSDQNSDEDEFYDNNYQYDGCIPSAYLFVNKAANVFVSKMGKESLKAVSFGTATASEDYTIKIYKDIKENSNPESGILVSTTNGKTTFEGMYTVKLDTPVTLEYGDRYSVVVELSGNKQPSFLAESSTKSSWFEANASAEAGQSFYSMRAGGWRDYGKIENANFRIKAYTDTISEDKEGVNEDDLEIIPDKEKLTFNRSNLKNTISDKVVAKDTGKSEKYYTAYELSKKAIEQGYSLVQNDDGTYEVTLSRYVDIPEETSTLDIYLLDYNNHKTSKYKSVTLQANTIDISRTNITVENSNLVYDGLEKEPYIMVKELNDEYYLCQNEDYEVEYSDNINAGTATATITGKGWYSGSVDKGFIISKADKSIYISRQTYNISDNEPVFSLGATTISGEKLNYSSTDNAVAKVDNDGNVTIEGSGIADIVITSPESDNYKSNSTTVRLYVTHSENGSTPAGGNTSGSGSTPAGGNTSESGSTPANGNASENGSTPAGGNTSGSEGVPTGGGAESDNGIKLLKKIYINKKSYTRTYGDRAFSLGASVQEGEELVYSSNDKKVVTVNSNGKVTIKGTGIAVITITSPESTRYNAAEPVKITIKVAPKAVSILSAKNIKGKKIKAAWKADKNASGYQIVYSLKKNFKNSKVVTIKSNKTTRMVIKKLKKGRTYYVRIRAYKTSKGRKIYGAYSKIIKSNIKK